MNFDEEFLAALGALVCIVLVIALVWAIIAIIARWKIFTKAGEQGWKALIPFYNMYTQITICAPVLIFWIYLGGYIVSAVFSRFDNTFCAILAGVGSLVVFVMNVFASLKLSKAFGHGVGFAIGLILLNPVFLLILGFGSSEYDPLVDKESWY